MPTYLPKDLPSTAAKARQRREVLTFQVGIIALAVLISRPATGQEAVKLEAIRVEAPAADGEQTGTTLGSISIEPGLPGGTSVPRSVTNDTARLLLDVPGVSVSEAGGISALPSVHGLSDDRLRVQVDGVDLMPACPNHMNPPLSYIAPTKVAKVTVFSGVAPVSVGGDSIGGTIVVRSAEPPFATERDSYLAHAHLGSFYRSNGQGLGFAAGATAASHWLSLTYDESISTSDNYHAGQAFKPAAAGREGGRTIPGDEVASSFYHGGPAGP